MKESVESRAGSEPRQTSSGKGGEGSLDFLDGLVTTGDSLWDTSITDIGSVVVDRATKECGIEPARHGAVPATSSIQQWFVIMLVRHMLLVVPVRGRVAG